MDNNKEIMFEKFFDGFRQELIKSFKALGEEKILVRILENQKASKEEYRTYFNCAWEFLEKTTIAHQQAKVEEQAKEISNLKSLIQGHELRHQQNLSIKQKLTRRSEELQKQKSLQELEVNQIAQANQVWQSKCQELQKRVDKAIRLLVEAELYQSEPNIDLAVKALKGEG
ncbi:hypothetical protein KWD60_01655 [Acinetobacter baumannii]